MAETEKRLIENVAALPESLQAEFLSQIQGAATALKVLEGQKKAADEKKA